MRKSVAVAFGLLLAGGTVRGQRYLITTVAGGGVPSTPALATSVALPAPASVATDTAGNVYFAAGNGSSYGFVFAAPMTSQMSMPMRA